MARQMGYSKITHLLEIFGICPRCQTALDNEPPKEEQP
jgi:Fe2+ or Zn2+ uptake regulation protein